MRSRVVLILTILGLVMAVSAAPVAAFGITVTSTADTVGDDGVCTLREAITAANTDTASGVQNGECPAGSGTDLISFSAAGSTITLTSALPDITTDMTISPASGATVSGASAFRVFVITTSTVTLSGLTITAGRSSDGGGIYNDNGTLTVTKSTISGNTAEGRVGFGGGIYNDNGTLTVTNSTIAENSANQGGGIYNDNGTLTVTNSTISGNTAGVSGGGIVADGTETLVNSLIVGNIAPVDLDISGTAETTTTSIVGVPVGLTLADILVPAGLANNGGPTQTIALAQVAANPAIDTGTSAVCSAPPINSLDQRGQPRPAACDIGAYEVQPAPVASALPNAAMDRSADTSPLATLGFAVLLIGALGTLAVVSSRRAVSRR